MNENQPRIVIAGGRGFLGHSLAGHFQQAGYAITVLTRSPQTRTSGAEEIGWDGNTLGDWTKTLEGAHAIINLAGRSVDCRYTARNKRLIMDSRVNPTRVIGEAIEKCNNPPSVWLNASTATIYKHTFGPAWTESGETGATPEAKDEFSIQVATAWEHTFNEARTPRTRRVALRAAMVLGTGGNSVFPTLRRLVRLGLGGRMGNGRQFASWIHVTDFCRGLESLMNDSQFSGPVNVCAPNPVTNTEMMKTFREVCGVPIGMPAPEWMLEIGAFVLRTETELLIKSRRVVPERLLQAGFDFQFPYLRQAVEDLQKKPKG